MGRTSKFVFPVPGRKQKQAPAPVQTGPMSKAQKILGSTELNFDAPKAWDAASNSGISVSISESTVSFNPSERTAGDRTARGRAAPQWEEESDTVPAHLRTGAGARPGTGRKGPAATGKENIDVSSVSSVGRRRQSTATIMSWYDKSRVPLAISQQTSASAMAKGLPTKANTLLDVDGSISKSGSKKRLTKLDFSYLLPRSRTSVNGPHTTLLGHDFVVKSPSVASLSTLAPQASPPSVGQPLERNGSRRSTRERLHHLVERSTHRQQEPVATRPSPSTEDVVNLHHLYDHYEKMSFKQVMNDDFEEDQSVKHTVLESVPETSGFPARPSQDSAPPKPAIREPRSQHTYFDPNKPISPNKAIMSPDTEYATSVSSRHTRTSKASKRTNQSLFDSDLQQTSVLSLSSDSEDDGSVDPPKSSTSTPGTRQDSSGEELVSPRAEQRRSHPARPSGKSGKHASFASSNTYLTIPNESVPPRQPQHITPRSSSLSQTTLQTHSSPRSSRLSSMSTSTTNSAMTWQSRPGYGVQEARTVTIMPPHLIQTSPERKQGRCTPPVLSNRSSLYSVDQPTPPLSPTSADVYIRPAVSVVPAANPNPRVMAVTKQEEMLLGALRMKRARMRETILNELNEEAVNAAPHHRASLATLRESTYDAASRAICKQASKGSISTITLDRQPSYHDGPSSVATLPTRTRSPAASITHSEPLNRKPKRKTSALQHEAAVGEAKHERIMLFLDQPADPVDLVDDGEPSPDLSDFMDFDNGSEEVSDDYALPLHVAGRAKRAAGESSSSKSSDTPKTPEIARPDSPPLSPKSPMPNTMQDDVHVVEEYSPLDDATAQRSASAQEALFPTQEKSKSKKKAVRLSAVGRVGMEAGLWGDDG